MGRSTAGLRLSPAADGGGAGGCTCVSGSSEPRPASGAQPFPRHRTQAPPYAPPPRATTPPHLYPRMSPVSRGAGHVPPPHSAGKLNPASSTTACTVAGLAGRTVLPVLLTLSGLGRLTPVGPREGRSPLLGDPRAGGVAPHPRRAARRGPRSLTAGGLLSGLGAVSCPGLTLRGRGRAPSAELRRGTRSGASETSPSPTPLLGKPRRVLSGPGDAHTRFPYCRRWYITSASYRITEDRDTHQ